MKTISRRNFITGAGAALAASSMASVAFADDAAVEFDDNYDVVVVGYGFAGGMAAISAADAGAEKVLLVDVAPEGQ